eukprot:TRINITY_DN7696_c0_g1_i2.p1 TRINITY_DN7696_c0_g1~~TRINITY_DN7696_c0_g1_i2.p1  ORF type:complete len:475 (-),score=50.05 TRINITY_DN7696_c0_g1_i2:218-1642(-)
MTKDAELEEGCEHEQTNLTSTGQLASHPAAKIHTLLTPWVSMMPRVRLQILMGCVCFANYLLRTSMGTCAVLMVQEYEWDLQAKGTLLGAFFWGYMVGNLLSGALSHEYGPGRVLACAALIWSALSIAIPFAADQGLTHVWIFQTLLGVSASPVMATTSALLATAVPLSERGRAIAARALALRAGYAVATVMAPFLCMLVGWRAVFSIFGSASFMFSVLFMGYVLTSTASPPVAAFSLRELEATGDADQHGFEDRVPQSQNAGVGYLSVLPLHVFVQPGFLSLLVSHCSANFALYTIMSWAPTYFTEVLHLPLEMVGLYLLVPAVSIGVGAVVAGLLMDRMLSRSVPLVTVRQRVLCPAACCGGAALLLFSSLSQPQIASVTITFAALCIGMMDAAMNANYMDIAPASTASVVSIANSVATLPGAVGPALVASLLSATGLWSLIWSSISACLFLSAVAFAYKGLRWVSLVSVAA